MHVLTFLCKCTGPSYNTREGAQELGKKNLAIIHLFSSYMHPIQYKFMNPYQLKLGPKQ